MRRVLAIGALMTLTSLSAFAADVGPLKGGWVKEGVSCQAWKDTSDESVMTITDKKFSGYESDCVIRSSKRSGSSFSLALLCESEGESTPSTFAGKFVGNDKLVVKGSFTYKRCQ